MGKATELKTTTELVKEVLKDNVLARSSDDYLYYKVCEKINGMYTVLPFWKVILNRKKYGFPEFESVRRSRQKIQAAHPELAGSKEAEAGRVVNEAVFKDYARQVGV